MLFINLFLSAFCLLWFGQNSVEKYWQQTYHRASPFQYESRWWLAGGKLQERAYTLLTNLSPSEQVTSIGNVVEEQPQYASQQVSPETTNTAAETLVASEIPEAASETEISATKTINTGLTKTDRVLFAGDSLMQGVAPYVIQQLNKTHQISSINLSKPSTGLSYKTFYDWEATIAETFANNPDIKLLVMMIGANDPWDFADPNNKKGKFLKLFTPEWERVYRERIENIINSAENNNAQVIWIGLPIMRSEKYNKKISYLNEIFAKTTHDRGVTFIPTSSLMSDNHNAYTDSIKINGKMTKVRHKDGIHFLLNGYNHIGREVIKHIKFAETL